MLLDGAEVHVAERLEAALHVLETRAAPLEIQRERGRDLPRLALRVAGLGGGSLVRFGADARTLLLDTGDDARCIELDPRNATRVRTSFMVPMARLPLDAAAGKPLGAEAGDRLRRFWRLGIAAEFLGLMDAALDLTVDYVKQRRQFGRAIGSFQAIQHRMAQCFILLEGGIYTVLFWLVRVS
ncbi:MAG: acyl-CoA dehydrogenase family protein [Myxococcota bacterium]